MSVPGPDQWRVPGTVLEPPRRPIPVVCAVVVVGLIGLALAAIFPLMFTPLVDGSAAPARPASLVAAVVFTVLTVGGFGTLALRLWKGGTAAVVIAVLGGVGGTGAALMYLAQAVLDHSRGASAAEILEGWFESPPEFVLGVAVAGALVPVVPVCLVLPRSLRWAVRMYRYDVARRVRRRYPNHHPPAPNHHPPPSAPGGPLDGR